jgi:adenylate cyclase class 1
MNLPQSHWRFSKKTFTGAQAGLSREIKPIIELFAIMGSAGSIAYNEDSDIDYWLCLDESLVDTVTIDKLKTKLRAVELWITENFNLETHYFLNDITRIKNDIFDSDEDDISGKALGKLLKDEFYRSSILLHGKVPFWWVVPPGTTDEAYKKYLNIIKTSKYQNDFIDLGNLHIIKKEEFLGAGLFQILKSLSNPFKSILKIGILEKYLLEEVKTPLLCNILKEKVQKEDLDINYIDPYILRFLITTKKRHRTTLLPWK